MFEYFFNFIFTKEDKPQKANSLKTRPDKNIERMSLSDRLKTQPDKNIKIMSLFNNLKGFNMKERSTPVKTSDYV